jgi:hypothetical protein
MTLTELIVSFKSKTGRLDLSDTEITALINASCRILDEIEDSELRTYRFFLAIAQGDYIAKLPDEFRYVKQVTLHVDDEATVLTYQKSDYVRALLRDSPDVCVVEDVYSIVSGGLTQDFTANTLPLYMDTVGLQTQPTDRNLYIIVYPKVSVDSVVEVDCVAYTTPLSATVTTNFWSIQRPELLIQGAHYLLIKDLINIDESTKILQDIKARVLLLSYDQYSSQHINSMEG